MGVGDDFFEVVIVGGEFRVKVKGFGYERRVDFKGFAVVLEGEGEIMIRQKAITLTLTLSPPRERGVDTETILGEGAVAVGAFGFAGDGVIKIAFGFKGVGGTDWIPDRGFRG